MPIPRVDCPMRFWTPYSSGRSSMPVISLPLVHHPAKNLVLDCISAPPVFLSVAFHYMCNCGRPVLLVFRSLAGWVALHVVIALMWSWEEVSSGSTIFLWSPPKLNIHISDPKWNLQTGMAFQSCPNLHFNNGTWCWTSLYVLAIYNSFLWKYLSMSFAHIF